MAGPAPGHRESPSLSVVPGGSPVKLVETLAAIETLDLRHAELLSQQEQAAVRAKTDPTVRQLRQRRAGLETLSQQQASALRQLDLEVAELRERVKTHEKAI